jgi:hypothetical protein
VYNLYTSKTLVQVYSNITLVVQGYRCSTVLLELFIVSRLVQGYSGTDVEQEYSVRGIVQVCNSDNELQRYRSSTGVQE